MSILSKIRKVFQDSLGPGSTAYGILKPCKRCVYQKSHEPILIVSEHRGPRIIIIPSIGAYKREGECLGFDKCALCFKQVNNASNLPCKWTKFLEL